MVQGIIFDFDDTLADSLETYWRIFCCGAEKLNLPAPSRQELALLLSEGKPILGIIAEVYPTLDKDTIQTCVGEMRQAASEVAQEFPITLKPEAKAVLGALKSKGLKIGLVTGRVFPSEEMWADLRKFDIARFFDAVVTGHDQPRKPAPEGVLKCLEEMKLTPEDCVFVGDTRADLIAGKKAGVRVIVLSNGAAISQALATEQPHAIIDNLSQLVGFLEQDTGHKQGAV